MSQITCPVCAKTTLSIKEVPYEVPYFGQILIITMQCSTCGFSHRDVINLSVHEPTRYEVTIENVEDLSIRVVRSSSATIRIPELGIHVEPGPLAEGFVSNVEGLLERVKNIVMGLKMSTEDPKEREKYEGFLKKVQNARDGKTKFTVILEDPLGNSAIISEKKEKVRRRTLSEREVKRLKTGYVVLTRVPQKG